MATLAQLGRERKNALRSLRKLSLQLNAAQEAADRELVRQINRKRAVPEAKDLTRLSVLLNAVQERAKVMMKGTDDLAIAFRV